MKRGRFFTLFLKTKELSNACDQVVVSFKCKIQSLKKNESQVFCVCIVGSEVYENHKWSEAYGTECNM